MSDDGALTGRQRSAGYLGSLNGALLERGAFAQSGRPASAPWRGVAIPDFRSWQTRLLMTADPVGRS